MWPLISLLVRLAAAGYLLCNLWRFLIVRKAGGFWDRLTPKRVWRGDAAGIRTPSVSRSDTGEVNVMGSSKTVYIPAPPAPQPKPESQPDTGPAPEANLQPASETADTGAGTEPRAVSTTKSEPTSSPEPEKIIESLILETVPVGQDKEPEPDPGDIEVETSETDYHEFVDEDDLPPPMDEPDGSSTGMMIEELDNASQVIHGVKTDEPSASNAAGTLYEVGQSGLVEFEGDERLMQERVVSLLKRFGYPSGAYSKWSDEEFSVTVFG
jgi:hypothetical protein